jgi:adenosylcobinamide kinase/adenosylcobinamide-phosphate guanylyltransferase
LLEAGPNLPEDLKRVSENDAVLIDALGGYVAQHLDSENDTWERQTEALLSQISFMKQTCVVVIEETGWGVVPSTAIGGLFRDRLGALAQRLDRQAVASWLVVQGRALDLHALGVPVP